MLRYLQSVEGASAKEGASGVGITRVTARSYVDYLEKQGKLQCYGGMGRPVNYYFSK